MRVDPFRRPVLFYRQNTCFLAIVAIMMASIASAATKPEISFQEWVRNFKAEAVQGGAPQTVVDAAFLGVSLNPRVVELDQRQPEFVTPIWAYLDSLVSEERITAGRVAVESAQTTLSQIEDRYGVPAEVVAAIWGVESNFGNNRGSFSVIEALATLAYDGRRESFGRNQLMKALEILTSGDVEPSNMVGSWAGAMGHTQFIPSSYLEYAVDFDGDGQRDIWADDPKDALASTANYLASFGWRSNEPWGFPVQLPGGFDYSLIGDLRLPTSAWAERGVRLQGGGDLPGPYDDAELILPAGAEGPAFLVLNNFRTILRYNTATSYALAVSLLSEQLGGRAPRVFKWPEDDLPLSRGEAKELQQALTELGFDAGKVDGILGRQTRSAVRGFQRSQSLIADGYPSQNLLELVRRAQVARDAPVLAIAGGPTNDADIREIQALLTGMGFDTGGVDGKVGRKTRRAISEFAKQRGMPSTDEPSPQLLSELRRAIRGQ